MGELILFRPGPGRSLKSKVPPASGAEIMFFTGVRYERMVEAAAVASGADPTPSETVGKAGRNRKRRRG
jgi:hypothetical protein